jgi:hypothetical protein
MAVKKSSHQSRRKAGKARKSADLIADLLAPLEEQESSSKQMEHNNGSILIDTGELKLPKGINEVEEERASFHLDTVVIVILVIAILFISFIAWLVSKEPPV